MNPLEHMKQLNESFPGLYRGEVMDNNDSDMLGRIKIKVFPVFKGIETIDLPWAVPAMSPFQGGSYQDGSFVIPRIGSHVFVMFEAGDVHQPVYFASAHAQQESQSKKDWHLRAQGLADPINTNKNANRKTGVQTASGDSWDEPTDQLGGYPDTAIIHTNSGHLVEVSDTNGKTRIHIYHQAGSYQDMRHNGDLYKKVENDCLEIIKGDKKISITGNQDSTVEGNKGTKISGNDVVLIEGAQEITLTGGNQTIDVTGNVSLTCSGIVEVVCATIKLGTSSLLKLVNETFQTLFNAHKHSGVDTGGGTSGVPTSLMSTAHLTSEVTAK